ncbi:nuclear body protein SP140-like protein isoform X3 [Nannospalax galili]|uniref:nuclear body protein SP140-like protein isoform X3 n=1 Tax=Nannospalax galili TaxID=1026970 RepID=UPI000819B24D|nr:nuclear body protein SP140-like protein isoform X3 [Nannospalax galili]
MEGPGSSLSTRMSTEDQNLEDRFPLESVFQHFKKYKVEISKAIKKPFPFLEGLRDRGLINDKMYEDLQDSCRNLIPIHKVVYRVLDQLEKTFDLMVLEALFSEVNMEEYPDLEHINRSFENVIQNKLCYQRGNAEQRGEDPNSQLSLEQGPGENCSQRSLTWSPLDPCCSDGISLLENGVSEHLCETAQMNREKGDTGSDKNDAPETQPASGSHAPEPELAHSCELIEAQGHSGGASLEAPSRLTRKEERVEPLTNGIQINPCSVQLVDIKKEKLSFCSEEQQNQASVYHNQASDFIVISSEDSDDGEEACTSAPSWSKPVDSRKSPTLTKMLVKRDSSDTGSTSSRRPCKRIRHTTDVGNNSTVRKDSGKRRRKRSFLGNYFIQNIKTPMQRGWSKGRRVKSRTSERGRKRGPRIARGNNVNFDLPELPVTCGDVKGTLYKEKLKQGIWKRSIRSENGRWFTPRQFEIKGKHKKSKNWKLSIRCDGWTLKELIEKEHLSNPPRAKKNVTLRTSAKLSKGTVDKLLENSKKCKVCRQGGKLHTCSCGKSYHKNCHIPPVETVRNSWRCTFCKTKAIRLRCQESQPRHEESKILAKRMLPMEQLKCELLLLIIYCHPESSFFAKKPHQKKEDFPDIQEYMWLNKIKNRLNKKVYRKDTKFVNLGVTVGAQFEMKFKSIFSIQDTSKTIQQFKPIILLT